MRFKRTVDPTSDFSLWNTETEYDVVYERCLLRLFLLLSL